MDKQGEGGSSSGFWLMLIFLALTPMCEHAGENSYTSCVDACEEIIFKAKYNNDSFVKKYYLNGTNVKEEYVDNYCYNECKNREVIN